MKDLKGYIKNLTLLCIDSSIITRAIYEDSLSILFKKVITSQSIDDALKIYNQNHIDIIITGYKFEVQNGIDFIKQIRKINANIPIIFASEFESIDVLTQALHLNVHNFIKKPFELVDLLSSIEDATKKLLAKKYIEEKEKEKIANFQKKIDYSNYQETLALQKEIKISRNDFYYKYVKKDKTSLLLIDFLYRAKDILCGDTYSARKVGNCTFLSIIDGMGKGVSASITSTIATAFINKFIDEKSNEQENINLKTIVSNLIDSIQSILLDEEILSASFLWLNPDEEYIEYSLFSMPPILLQKEGSNEVVSLKSNNPAINPYTYDFKTDKLSTSNLTKLLVYSDGLIENSLKNENSSYAKYIKEDFKNSINREDLKAKFMEKISEQEDDISFIFLSKINLENKIDSMSIKTSIDDIEKSQEWFSSILDDISVGSSKAEKLSIAFNELMLNAYEHGNLQIDNRKKHKLIEEDKYFDYLTQKESTCKKEILIDTYIFKDDNQQKYLIIIIKDEGKGFDTSMLSNIFGISKSFNQRGVFMSRKYSLGIYYNDKANEVVFISKL
ncbi:SpoIIE family protein phosphatase [Sulfurospirillum sp. 1307]|jgi:serine phosphatase RsbU (regulator of sigma subunit)/anti-sigma regulatory factor (Ser/Thr protein kinase)